MFIIHRLEIDNLFNIIWNADPLFYCTEDFEENANMEAQISTSYWDVNLLSTAWIS